MNTLPQDRDVNYVTLAEVRKIQPECFPLSDAEKSALCNKFQIIDKTDDVDKHEQAVACLIKAAIDAAMALDVLKCEGSNYDRDRIIVERVFSSCEALQK
jgi:hypothetical protein